MSANTPKRRGDNGWHRVNPYVLGRGKNNSDQTNNAGTANPVDRPRERVQSPREVFSHEIIHSRRNRDVYEQELAQTYDLTAAEAHRVAEYAYGDPAAAGPITGPDLVRRLGGRRGFARQLYEDHDLTWAQAWQVAGTPLPEQGPMPESPDGPVGEAVRAFNQVWDRTHERYVQPGDEFDHAAWDQAFRETAHALGHDDTGLTGEALLTMFDKPFNPQHGPNDVHRQVEQAAVFTRDTTGCSWEDAWRLQAGHAWFNPSTEVPPEPAAPQASQAAVSEIQEIRAKFAQLPIGVITDADLKRVGLTWDQLGLLDREDDNDPDWRGSMDRYYEDQARRELGPEASQEAVRERIYQLHMEAYENRNPALDAESDPEAAAPETASSAIGADAELDEVAAKPDQLPAGSVTAADLERVGVTPDQFQRLAERDAENETDPRQAEISRFAEEMSLEEAQEIDARAKELSAHMRGCNLAVEQCGTCVEQERDSAADWWDYDVEAARQRLATAAREQERDTTTPQTDLEAERQAESERMAQARARSDAEWEEIEASERRGRVVEEVIWEQVEAELGFNVDEATAQNRYIDIDLRQGEALREFARATAPGTNFNDEALWEAVVAEKERLNRAPTTDDQPTTESSEPEPGRAPERATEAGPSSQIVAMEMENNQELLDELERDKGFLPSEAEDPTTRQRWLSWAEEVRQDPEGVARRQVGPLASPEQYREFQAEIAERQREWEKGRPERRAEHERNIAAKQQRREQWNQQHSRDQADPGREDRTAAPDEPASHGAGEGPLAAREREIKEFEGELLAGIENPTPADRSLAREEAIDHWNCSQFRLHPDAAIEYTDSEIQRVREQRKQGFLNERSRVAEENLRQDRKRVVDEVQGELLAGIEDPSAADRLLAREEAIDHWDHSQFIKSYARDQQNIGRSVEDPDSQIQRAREQRKQGFLNERSRVAEENLRQDRKRVVDEVQGELLAGIENPSPAELPAPPGLAFEVDDNAAVRHARQQRMNGLTHQLLAGVDNPSEEDIELASQRARKMLRRQEQAEFAAAKLQEGENLQRIHKSVQAQDAEKRAAKQQTAHDTGAEPEATGEDTRRHEHLATVNREQQQDREAERDQDRGRDSGRAAEPARGGSRKSDRDRDGERDRADEALARMDAAVATAEAEQRRAAQAEATERARQQQADHAAEVARVQREQSQQREQATTVDSGASVEAGA